MGRFKVGETVVFTEVPESLVHDLPDEDRAFIAKHVNQVAVIEKIEPKGFYWLGFDVEMIDGKAQAKKKPLVLCSSRLA